MSEASLSAPDADALRAVFDRPRPFTVGVEEELMLLDPRTLDLLPRAAELLAKSALDERFKLELPASHLEIVTRPTPRIDEIAGQLREARQVLAQRWDGRARLALAGVHPFAAAQGALNAGARYERIDREYGPVARRQLLCGLHVHLGLSGAGRVLAVHNAMREYLPLIAALAANAPVYGGHDSGMASVRPLISGLLPRQGVPPVLSSWSEFAAHLRWGQAGGRLGRAGEWWWELRPHVDLGTLEVRVPDAQSTVQEAVAVAAVVLCLGARLSARHDEGSLPRAADTWRIAENRWSAARHGTAGQMIDPRNGEVQSTREKLGALLEELAPAAAELGATAHLQTAAKMAEHNGADRQRAVLGRRGARGLTEWLTERFGQSL